MPLFTPDDYLSSVVLVDPEALCARGVRVVLLDIDNTLVPRDTHILSAETKAWVMRLKANGLRPCLLSNNWHRVVFSYAEELDIPIVYKAMKPLPFGYLRALRKVARTRDERAVMIGDQIFTDVLGARIIGLSTILVTPQATKDLWYTLLLRRLEQLVLGAKRPRA